MKTFRFKISEVFSKHIEIEADNIKDAKGKAEDILSETSLSHDYIVDDDPDVIFYNDVELEKEL